MKRLILIRHGQSLWNAENKFTGWVDSPLSYRGIQEAIKAGKLIQEFNIDIEGAFTSFLSRAIDTLNLLNTLNLNPYPWQDLNLQSPP